MPLWTQLGYSTCKTRARRTPVSQPARPSLFGHESQAGGHTKVLVLEDRAPRSNLPLTYCDYPSAKRSRKALDLGTTETDHVDQLKNRPFACTLRRHGVRRNGRFQGRGPSS